VADADLQVTGRADRAGLSSGAWLLLVARAAEADRFYAARVDLMQNSFAVVRFESGQWTTLGSGPVPSPAFAADTDYTIRFQVQGTALRARWWRAGQPEPVAWAVEVADASFASGRSGVAGAVRSAATAVGFAYDDFLAAAVTGGASGPGGPSGPGEPSSRSRIVIPVAISWSDPSAARSGSASTGGPRG
jgi:hypothetical protein